MDRTQNPTAIAMIELVTVVLTQAFTGCTFHADEMMTSVSAKIVVPKTVLCQEFEYWEFANDINASCALRSLETEGSKPTGSKLAVVNQANDFKLLVSGFDTAKPLYPYLVVRLACKNTIPVIYYVKVTADELRSGSIDLSLKPNWKASNGSSLLDD